MSNADKSKKYDKLQKCIHTQQQPKDIPFYHPLFQVIQ